MRGFKGQEVELRAREIARQAILKVGVVEVD